jgi:uncharacterized membrane protein YgdD (TMEM256/DUF423 family)
MKRRFAAPAAFFGLCAVLAGAFGTHALRARLAPDMLAVVETAARYQMYHALALLFVSRAAMAPGISRTVPAAGWFFIAGTAVFSGSLYALALTGVRVLGAVTPIGGALLLAGWTVLAWGACFARGTALRRLP